MKKYVYILLLLASVSTLTTAQIKIGNYTFKDGGEYTGELKGRKPNGKGKTIYKNGNTYEGEYIKGKREGNGTYTSVSYTHLAPCLFSQRSPCRSFHKSLHIAGCFPILLNLHTVRTDVYKRQAECHVYDMLLG